MSSSCLKDVTEYLNKRRMENFVPVVLKLWGLSLKARMTSLFERFLFCYIITASGIPTCYTVSAIHGFVEELVVKR